MAVQRLPLDTFFALRDVPPESHQVLKAARSPSTPKDADARTDASGIYHYATTQVSPSLIVVVAMKSAEILCHIITAVAAASN